MGRPSFALACALGAALGALGHAPLAVAGTPPSQAAGAGRPAATMALVSQTPWVGPGQTMVLHLALRGAPLSSLELSLTLYGHLTSRSAFSQTVAGTPEGRVLGSTTVPAASLAGAAGGTVTVSVPVASGDAPAAGAGTFTAELDCPPGSCGGVYPLRLQLSEQGTTVGSMFTYLVYASPPAGTQRVRLAWIVPLELPTVGPLGPPASPSGPEPEVTGATTAALSAVLGVLSSHPAVPLTLAPSPATVAALSSSSRPAARSALAAMEALAVSGGRQVLAGPYVPVDAGAVVSAGLGGELADQLRRGGETLAPLHPSAGTWLASGPLDQAALDALGSLGDDRLVVPASDVSAGFGPSLSTTAPFMLGAGRSVTLLGVESDTQLASEATAPGAGLLDAYRLLADLALLYYEQPNDATPRGVVLSTPAASPLDPAVVDTVLGALPEDPLVSPVTLDQLFAQVPASGPRRLSGVPVSAGVPARLIRRARARLGAFASAVDPSGAAVVRALDERLLWSEDGQLRPAQQQLAVAAFDRALEGQLSRVSIRADTIKLTSNAAKVPLTVVKQSGYAVSGTLRVSGDKVVFPPGASQDPGPVCRSSTVQDSAGRSSFTCQAELTLATNAVYVDMRARVAGDFRLDVTLTSPSGGLVLASTHVTVHSMSTSLVAVALSVLALAVLLWWWARTARRRRPPRRAGRGAHVRRSTPAPPVGVS
jgi:hypothetical protein